MADKSPIEWTDASWNPLRARNTATGKVGWFCVHVSEGCRNCYAEGFNRRLGTKVDYKPQALKAGQVELFLDPVMLTQPMRWNRPRMIFVCSMTDVFADFVTDDQLDQIFAVMALCPQHVFQILTKRPERMRAYLAKSCGRIADTIIRMRRERGDRDMVLVPLAHVRPGSAWWPLPNVWLGVSVEDQARADERIPVLLDTPAAVRWISAEPLLGPVDLLKVGEWADKFEDCGGHPDPHWPSDTQDWTWLNGLTGCYEAEARAPSGEHLGSIDVGLLPLAGGIDWVVAGGESGPGARPMHPDWARQLRDQCDAAGVPFLFKQWGAWKPAPLGAGPELHSKGTPLASLGVLGPNEQLMVRVGKKAAGRLLDGVLHDGFPEATGL